jgi:arylformamidase
LDDEPLVRARSPGQLAAVGRQGLVMPVLAQYASESGRMRARLPCRLSVPYGASEPERLDIFPATTTGPSPIFVFLHGGYWRLLDSADSCFMAECLTRAGACVVAVNYALAPLVLLAEFVRQCRAAVAWLHKHAHEFGGDPTQIHVGGSSAGGHLAAMMLAPGWEPDFGVPNNLVAGATLLSGLYDLEPIRLGHPNEWLERLHD